MQIRVLRNLGTGWPRYNEGEIVDADTKTGEALVSQGLAEAMPIQAVPSQPMTPLKTVTPETSTKKAKK